ncbi:NAD-dependent succinate-semialdehyde dehydrogenase [Sphingomonas sp.]|uniref:NAD-dependent succinate-semialdehyde dehydrogenase n=1 Tax=Sphingomonas sp. TaxID=28214 RepID=UPI0025D86427|nr:NAD-dependent succinate-semialdehyde dehydrogenase [Sphingomonas sp.]
MFKSINPATGDEIGTYPELTSEELEGKVARAASRFASWRFSPVPERTQLLEKIAEIFDTRLEPMARMASAEMGKTLVSARAEVQKCAAAFRYYAQNGEAFLKPRPIAGAKGEVHLLPLGVILAVMPWNFPYWQAVRFLAPTILAGNVGLLKHASIVQGVAGMIEEAVIAAGAPDGLFQNLAIKSGNVAALIADERVAAVTLTGSEGAGRSVAVAAGGALKKAVLELGGSDPFIVMPSADLDLAVKAAVTARIQNSGQSCVCAKRMIVHADVYDAFAERFIAGMLAAKAGDPMDPASDMGPLSSFEQMDTVLGQLEEAKAAGATLIGGEALPGKGAYIGGGVLTGVPLDSKLAHEEIFGPIAMLFKVADIDEAIRLANAIPFGLGSSVWTREPAEEARFIVGIEAGMTAVNQMLASAPEAPFGGIKRSGHGRELGQWGLHEFMNVKTVLRSGTSGGPDRS